MRAPWIGFVVACALTAGPPELSAQSDSGIAFAPGDVELLAAKMATKPFVPPTENVPEQWAKLNYDQYRDIRFRSERAVWRGQGRNFELHLLPSGWLYKQPISINIVEDGRARPIEPDNGLFEFGALAGPPPEGKVMGFFGFSHQWSNQPPQRVRRNRGCSKVRAIFALYQRGRPTDFPRAAWQ